MYQTVGFSRLLSLVPFATEFQLERAIVDVALANELQVKQFTCIRTLNNNSELNMQKYYRYNKYMYM